MALVGEWLAPAFGADGSLVLQQKRPSINRRNDAEPSVKQPTLR
jgi:hypothetical protein